MLGRRSDKRFACPICAGTFTRKSRMIMHIKQQHSLRYVKEFECQVPLCGKKFTEAGNLKAHQKTHTLEKPFPCRYCDMTFSISANLRDHTRRHLNNK